MNGQLFCDTDIIGGCGGARTIWGRRFTKSVIWLLVFWKRLFLMVASYLIYGLIFRDVEEWV